jgi:hypothetical protein
LFRRRYKNICTVDYLETSLGCVQFAFVGLEGIVCHEVSVADIIDDKLVPILRYQIEVPIAAQLDNNGEISSVIVS